MNNFSTVHFLRNGEWIEARCYLLESPMSRSCYWVIRVTKSVPGKKLMYDFMYPRATSNAVLIRFAQSKSWENTRPSVTARRISSECFNEFTTWFKLNYQQ